MGEQNHGEDEDRDDIALAREVVTEAQREVEEGNEEDLETYLQNVLGDSGNSRSDDDFEEDAGDLDDLELDELLGGSGVMVDEGEGVSENSKHMLGVESFHSKDSSCDDFA